MLLHLWQRLFPNFELSASSENTDNTSLTNTNAVNDGQSLADEFAKFDDNSFESVEFNEIVSIRREMACFEANSKSRPQRFQIILNALLTIKPTSTEPERAFSIMRYFCTKLRNRMGDDVLDALSFMRQYLKNKNEKK